jgi:hypothetical protein
MTSAIKPPGSGGPIPGIGLPPTDATPTEAVDRVQGTATSAVGGPNAALVEQLRQGVLTSAQVVDALVSRALEQARAQGLPTADEAGLETMLRSALANDPTLVGLARELER